MVARLGVRLHDGYYERVARSSPVDLYVQVLCCMRQSNHHSERIDHDRRRSQEFRVSTSHSPCPHLAGVAAALGAQALALAVESASADAGDAHSLHHAHEVDDDGGTDTPPRDGDRNFP